MEGQLDRICNQASLAPLSLVEAAEEQIIVSNVRAPTYAGNEPMQLAWKQNFQSQLTTSHSLA